MGEQLKTRLLQIDIYQCAENAVPAYLPWDLREDAVQSLVTAMWEGKFPKEDVRLHVKQHVSAARGLSHKFGMASLDGIVPGTDSLKLIDTIASDREHF